MRLLGLLQWAFLGFVSLFYSKKDQNYQQQNYDNTLSNSSLKDNKDLQELDSELNNLTSKKKEERVYVIKKDGVVLEHAGNLSRLAVKSKLNRGSVHKYYNNTNYNKSNLFKKKYEIESYKI